MRVFISAESDFKAEEPCTSTSLASPHVDGLSAVRAGLRGRHGPNTELNWQMAPS